MGDSALGQTRNRALVGECISRASVESQRDATLADLEAAIGACDYERAATIAFARARAGSPVGTDVIGRILPGIELPAITCSLIAIAPSRRDLVDTLDHHRFPGTKDAAELEAITLYAAWKAGAEVARVIPHLRRLSARSLTAESYALLATIAATVDDPNVVAATRPIAPFAKEYAKNVAADDKAMHASLDAVIAELPTEVEASTAAGFTVRAAKQAGRNDPCPCGSGLKFKKCCADKPVAAPSPIPGLSWDEFLAGDRITPDHIEDLGVRDLVRIELPRVPDQPLRALFRRLVVAREWAHVERVRLEAVRRSPPRSAKHATSPDVPAAATATAPADDPVIGDELTEELAMYLLDDGDLARARPLIASLPDDMQRDYALDLAIADGPEPAYRALVEHTRRAVASTSNTGPDLPDLDLAYTLLRAEPVLGILAARACIGTLHVDDADLLLDLVEEARDRLNLPPSDAAWDVLDALTEKSEGKGKGKSKGKGRGSKAAPERVPTPTLDAALAESSARVDQLERSLAATRAELADARTRPAAELVRAPEAASGLDGKVRELEALIREGNAERRELRKQLEAYAAEISAARDAADASRERQDSPRARRATLDEPDDGFDDSLDPVGRSESAPLHPGPGSRDITLPRFERRFVDALGEVPAQVAAETMRTIGTLAAGDGFAWRNVKQAKDMARQVLMARVGIHHRLIFRIEDDAMTVLDLITREQLDTTLKRLRMNR